MKSLTHKIMEALAIYGSRTVITPAVAEDLQEAMKLNDLKIVPIEPTQAMLDANLFGHVVESNINHSLRAAQWRAMVRAAE